MVSEKTVRTEDAIAQTQIQKLCISCGICAANCPKECIRMVRKGYEVMPVISGECVHCGICSKVCPARKRAEYNSSQDMSRYLLGSYKEILCVQAKDEKILKQAASGGFITQMVAALLEQKVYQSAFLVKDRAYSESLSTERFTAEDDLGETAKSRYLTVSHEATVYYIRNHPQEKIIVTGTGCAVLGILNSLALCHINRNNYLFIGLFCDKTMHYGVQEYFSQHPCAKGREMCRLYFRTKDAGGWPGNVRIGYTDGSYEDLPNTERMKVKEYFMPERCLYCLDKLNRNCDIAVGDNYIKENADRGGGKQRYHSDRTGQADLGSLYGQI